MIFHKHKVMFTGIPKNASSSLFDVLKNPTDKEHNHLTFIDEFSHNDPDLLESYLSFAIVRNPYDRFISACHQIRRDNPEKNAKLTLDEIIAQEHPSQLDFCNDIFYPQYRFIALGNKVLVDEVLKYENLAEEWSNFLKKYESHFQFPVSSKIPFSNKTDNRNTWETELKEISEPGLRLINEIYSRDFKLFNYKKITYDNL
jgi:chondroitin 4-sulfotransferase 11